jgi:hypothetical protein
MPSHYGAHATMKTKSTGVMAHAKKYENYGRLSETEDCALKRTFHILENKELSLFRTLSLARRQGSKKKKVKERNGMTLYEL